MKRTGLYVLALVSALTLGCSNNRREAAANAPAGSPGAVGTAGASDVSRGDKTFVHDIAGMNMAEIELSRVAAEKSASADVKSFARKIVDEHTAAGDKLKSIASQYSIDVPTALSDKDRDRTDKLASKQGLDFDRDYVDAIINGHDDFVNKLESRVDKETLGKWKAETPAPPRPGGPTVEERGHTVVILPEKSDNPVTQSINQWAADIYPAATMHLDRAKALKDSLKKRSTD